MCGWYIYCYSSTLRYGPPQNYKKKKYGPKKGNGEYVHTGDSAGVVMDTAKGELSFVLNGMNLDVVYEGVPLTSLSSLVLFLQITVILWKLWSKVKEGILLILSSFILKGN